MEVGVVYTGHYSFYTCRAEEGTGTRIQSVVVEQLLHHGTMESYVSVCSPQFYATHQWKSYTKSAQNIHKVKTIFGEY